MFSQKLTLCALFVLMCGPNTSIAAPLFAKKRSNFPCLIGNPEFSEQLIAYNPWHSEKVYSLSDNILTHFTAVIQMPTVPIDKNTASSLRVNSVKSMMTKIDGATKDVSLSGNIKAVWDVGIYFNRLSALYISGLENPKTYALVFGNDQQFSGTHISIGQFPIHFGSGISEYPLIRPLETAIGAAVNRRALSINQYHLWNSEHKTKLRVFGFLNERLIRFEVVEKLVCNKKNKEGKLKNISIPVKGTGKYAGFNLQHEWTPAFGKVTAGLSLVNCLPLDTGKKYGPQHEAITGDIYTHINIGPFKFKAELLDGGICGRPIRESLGFSALMKENKKSKKPKVLSHAWHTELAYTLPTQQDTTMIAGYTMVHKEPQAKTVDRQLIFGGVKKKLMDNAFLIIGIQSEVLPPEKKSTSQDKSEQKDTETLTRTSTVHVQLNLTA